MIGDKEPLYSGDAFYIVMALFPVMAVYTFLPAFSLGYLLIATVLVLSLFSHHFHMDINVRFLLVMLYFIVTNLIVGVVKYTDLTNTLNNSFGMIIFTIIGSFALVAENYSLERAYGVIKRFGAVFTVFLIIQVIAYHVLGMPLSGEIPFLEKVEAGNYFRSITYGRPTSVFVEPAHYIIFIAPLYAISMIRRDYGYFLLFLSGLLLSTSSTGYFLLVFIPLFILFTTDRSAVSRTLAVIAGAVVLVLVSPDLIAPYLSKFSLDALMRNPRVLGTLHYFRAFGTTDLLFGIGYNRLSEVLVHSLIAITTAANYSNAYLFGFMSFGLIGGSLWTLYTISLYFRIRKDYRAIFVILIFICLTDQVLFNRNLLYLLWWTHVALKQPEVSGLNETQ